MPDTTYTLLPWNGGQANVTAANTERAAAPMTPLAKGSGPDRVSADGQYRYLREDGAWWVQHLPSGQWITHLSGLTIGFTSCATARRWTANANPVPTGWNTKTRLVEATEAVIADAVAERQTHVESAGFHGDAGLSVLRAAGMSVPAESDEYRAMLAQVKASSISIADLIGETRQAMARLAATRTDEPVCDWCVVGKPCTCRADSTDPLD